MDITCSSEPAGSLVKDIIASIDALHRVFDRVPALAGLAVVVIAGKEDPSIAPWKARLAMKSGIEPAVATRFETFFAAIDAGESTVDAITNDAGDGNGFNTVLVFVQAFPVPGKPGSIRVDAIDTLVEQLLAMFSETGAIVPPLRGEAGMNRAIASWPG
jgi:hypothetical protein